MSSTPTNLPIDTIIQGDCLEIMREIPNGSVTAIVTDPPYGLEFRGNDWDASIPDWFGEARRIAKNVLFTTAPTTQWDYPRPDWVCCWYRPGSISRNVQGGFNHWSPILMYGDVKFQVDSIKLTHVYPSGFPHPTPKPEKLFEWLIKNCSKEGDVILDPFFGSGTTGVAAKQLGRHFIGIEISPEYCAFARKRLDSYMNQSTLTGVLA